MARSPISNENYKVSDGTIVDDADLSSWGSVQGAGTTTISSDTDTVRESATSIYLEGATGDGNNYHTRDLAVSHTFNSQGCLQVSAYFPERYDGSAHTFKIFLSDAASLAAGTGRLDCVISDDVKMLPGWGLFPLFYDDMQTVDGAPTDALEYISARIRIDGLTTNGLDRKCYYDGMLRGYRSRPNVLITFDDAVDTSYSIGHVQAQLRSIPLCHFIIPEDVDTAGNITTANIATMQAAGDCFGVHDSGANWPTYDAALGAQIEALISDMKDLGVSSEIISAGWPAGDIGDTEKNWWTLASQLRAAGIKLARTSTPGYNYPGKTENIFQYGVSLNNSALSLAQAKTWVDRAIESGSTVTFYGHHIRADVDTVSWTQANFEGLLDYIEEKRNDGLLETPGMNDYINNMETGYKRSPA